MTTSETKPVSRAKLSIGITSFVILTLVISYLSSDMSYGADEFGEGSADWLMESAKTMIPVLTGFVVFFSAALAKIWEDESKHGYLRQASSHIVGVVFLTIGGLGLWVGTLPAAAVSDYHQSYDWYLLGATLARSGTILFFAALAWSLRVYFSFMPKK